MAAYQGGMRGVRGGGGQTRCGTRITPRWVTYTRNITQVPNADTERVESSVQGIQRIVKFMYFNIIGSILTYLDALATSMLVVSREQSLRKNFY